jgi:hypothetical protein
MKTVFSHDTDIQAFCEGLLLSAQQMKRGEVSRTQWLNAKVQASWNDPRPSVSHDQVMAKARALLNRLQVRQ